MIAFDPMATIGGVGMFTLDATESFSETRRGIMTDGSRTDCVSRTVDAIGVLPGQAVFGASTNRVCSILETAGDFLGIAMSDYGLPASRIYEPAQPFYEGGETVSIATGGKITVLAGSAANIGDPVYVTPASALTAVASGNTRIRAAWADRVSAAGQVARIRLF